MCSSRIVFWAKNKMDRFFDISNENVIDKFRLELILPVLKHTYLIREKFAAIKAERKCLFVLKR